MYNPVPGRCTMYSDARRGREALPESALGTYLDT